MQIWRTISLFSTRKIAFIGKSRVYRITTETGPLDKVDYDGSALLLNLCDYEHIYICGYEIMKTFPEYRLMDFISLIGKNTVPSIIAIGNTYK